MKITATEKAHRRVVSVAQALARRPLCDQASYGSYYITPKTATILRRIAVAVKAYEAIVPTTKARKAKDGAR